MGSVLAGIPQVMTGHRVDRAAAIGADERAVQRHVGPARGRTGGKHLVQVRRLGGEHIDALVQIAVAGGQRNPGVGGEHPHIGVLAEPAQHQHRLGRAGRGTGANAGAPAQPFSDQQLGQQRRGVGGHVQRGRVGDHVGSSWCRSFP
jgi:hypothetical protein